MSKRTRLLLKFLSLFFTCLGLLGFNVFWRLVISPLFADIFLSGFVLGGITIGLFLMAANDLLEELDDATP